MAEAAEEEAGIVAVRQVGKSVPRLPFVVRIVPCSPGHMGRIEGNLKSRVQKLREAN